MIEMDDAKLQLLTYRPKDYLKDWLEFSPLQRAMQRKSNTPSQPIVTNNFSHTLKHSSPVPPPLHECRLFALPLEVLHQILLHLPVDSLSTLLTLSSGGHRIVTSHGSYPLLSIHLLELIRALRLTGLSSAFTLSHLLTALYTSKCFLCSDAPDHLYLPSLTRYCIACLSCAKSTIPMKRRAIRKWYGLRRKDLVGVPQMPTLVGAYGWGILHASDDWREFFEVEDLMEPVSNSELLMDGELARRRAIFLGKSKKDERRFNDFDGHPIGRRFKASIVFPPRDRETGDAEICVRCRGCKVFYDEKVREMLAMPDESEAIDFTGAIDLYGLEGLTFRFYTRRGFLAHLEQCTKSQEIWEEEVNRRKLEDMKL